MDIIEDTNPNFGGIKAQGKNSGYLDDAGIKTGRISDIAVGTSRLEILGGINNVSIDFDRI